MSNFQIHELTTKAINRFSKIIHDTLNGDSYETGNNIAGAIADLASANVAAPYNSATTYAIGQYCLYEGNIYRCIAITTGTFDATKWTQIVVTSEFRRVVELTTAQYEALSSAEQNNGTLYIITDGIPPSETVTGSDIIPFIDVSDSNKPKSTTAAAVANLATAYSYENKPCLISLGTGNNLAMNVQKVGKIVICNFIGYLNTTATITVGQTLFDGLPKIKDFTELYYLTPKGRLRIYNSGAEAIVGLWEIQNVNSYIGFTLAYVAE